MMSSKFLDKGHIFFDSSCIFLFFGMKISRHEKFCNQYVIGHLPNYTGGNGVVQWMEVGIGIIQRRHSWGDRLRVDVSGGT